MKKKKREKFSTNTENWFNNLGKVFDHKIGSGGNRITFDEKHTDDYDDNDKGDRTGGGGEG